MRAADLCVLIILILAGGWFLTQRRLAETLMELENARARPRSPATTPLDGSGASAASAPAVGQSPAAVAAVQTAYPDGTLLEVDPAETESMPTESWIEKRQVRGWTTRRRDHRPQVLHGRRVGFFVDTGMKATDSEWRDGVCRRSTTWNFDGRITKQAYKPSEFEEFVKKTEPPWWWGAADQTEPTAPWWTGDPPDDAERLAEIDTAITKLRSGNADVNWHGYRKAIEGLAMLGTPQAVDRLLELFEDPDVDFPHKSTIFAQVFKDIDDPRVYEASRRILEGNLEKELTSWPYTTAYIGLIVSHGGEDGINYLLDLRESGRIRHMNLRGQETGELPVARIVAAVQKAKHPHAADDLLHLLASSRDEDARAALRELVWENESIYDGTRAELWMEYGSRIGPSDAPAFVEGYWAAQTPADRRIWIEGLGGLCRNRDLDKTTLWPRIEATIIDALDEDEARSSALSCIQGIQDLHTEAVLRKLQELLPTVEPERQKYVRRAQSYVEKTLGQD